MVFRKSRPVGGLLEAQISGSARQARHGAVFHPGSAVSRAWSRRKVRHATGPCLTEIRAQPARDPDASQPVAFRAAKHPAGGACAGLEDVSEIGQLLLGAHGEPMSRQYDS